MSEQNDSNFTAEMAVRLTATSFPEALNREYDKIIRKIKKAAFKGKRSIVYDISKENIELLKERGFEIIELETLMVETISW